MPATAAFTCPRGHRSLDPDWCDVCGLALAPAPTGTSGSRPVSSGASVRRCAVCDEQLDGRFCETCGHDSEIPAPVDPAPPSEPIGASQEGDGSAPPPPTWSAVVRADRAWFDAVRRQHGADAATLEFPHHAPERRVVLTGPQVAIGRRHAARGTAPEIDLGGVDPGVSAAHAVLVIRPDGGWALVDVGSTNGTTLAVEDGPIPPHRPVPLDDGAVVRLGAWTTITITADRPDGPGQSR